MDSQDANQRDPALQDANQRDPAQQSPSQQNVAWQGAELARYSRHLQLPEVGLEGQAKLRQSSVLLVGAGGLGVPLALYLAAAGVGRLSIVDDDRVELTNLQRQVIYRDADLDQPKATVLAEALRARNPHGEFLAHRTRFDQHNALKLTHAHDLVVDGSDNFTTRYLVNDAAFFARKPQIYGAIYRFEGQVSVFDTPHGGGCYRCLFPRPAPPSLAPG